MGKFSRLSAKGAEGREVAWIEVETGGDINAREKGVEREHEKKHRIREEEDEKDGKEKRGAYRRADFRRRISEEVVDDESARTNIGEEHQRIKNTEEGVHREFFCIDCVFSSILRSL